MSSYCQTMFVSSFNPDFNYQPAALTPWLLPADSADSFSVKHHMILSLVDELLKGKKHNIKVFSLNPL